MFYYVIKNNQVLAKPDYLPDEDDLKSREEILVTQDENVPLHKGVFSNGKVIEKQESAYEKVCRERQEIEGKIDHNIRAQFLEWMRKADQFDAETKELMRIRDKLHVEEDQLKKTA